MTVKQNIFPHFDIISKGVFYAMTCPLQLIQVHWMFFYIIAIWFLTCLYFVLKIGFLSDDADNCWNTICWMKWFECVDVLQTDIEVDKKISRFNLCTYLILCRVKSSLYFLAKHNLKVKMINHQKVSKHLYGHTY